MTISTPVVISYQEQYVARILGLGTDDHIEDIAGLLDDVSTCRFSDSADACRSDTARLKRYLDIISASYDHETLDTMGREAVKRGQFTHHPTWERVFGEWLASRPQNPQNADAQ